MKKQFILLAVFSILLYSSCIDEERAKKENSETSKLLSTRAAHPIVSFTGEKNPIVGHSYPYKVSFSAINSYSRVSIHIKNSYTGTFFAPAGGYANSLFLGVNQFGTSLDFKVLWLDESTNNSINIYSDSQFAESIYGNLDGINIKRTPVLITAPEKVVPGATFEVVASFSDLANTSEITWKYVPSEFELISNNKNVITRKITAQFKAKKIVSNSNITLNITEIYSPKGEWFTSGIGTHTISVINPFIISSPLLATCSGSQITFEMSNFNMVSNASVTWTAGNGLSLASGQNTKRAIFNVLETYCGYSNVNATIIYNNTTQNEKSKSFWIGLPIINRTGNKDLVIGDRRDEVAIRTTIEGNTSNPIWKLIEGNATITPHPDQAGVNIKSLAPESHSEKIIVSVEVSNPCGSKTEIFEISVLKTPEIIPGQYIVGIPRIEGTTLRYPLTYKAISDHYIYSLYATILYKGAYDGNLAPQNWDWTMYRGCYSPPTFDAVYGNTIQRIESVENCGVNSTRRVKAGTTFTIEMDHNLLPGKTLDDIEYLMIYYYDAAPLRRDYDLHDFVYKF